MDIRLISGLVGVAVGALAVGGVWIVVGASGGQGSFAAEKAEVALPPKIGAYARFADIRINQVDKAKPLIDRTNAWNARNAERLSEAFGGAGAAVETYADDEYLTKFSLEVVRGTSPFPPYVEYVDPKELRVVRPMREMLRFGEVACVVQNQVRPQGQKPKPEDRHTAACVRTGPGLTVQISNVTGGLNQRPQDVATLVDEVWAAVS